MDQPAPQFFPAWDVRESWQPWAGWAVAGLIFWLVAVAAWRLWRLTWRPDVPIGREPEPGRDPATWKVAGSLGVVFLLGVFVATCSNGIYALRAPLARGDAVYSVGQVANTRFEGVPGSTRNIWRLFDVSGQIFLMPFLNPHLCVPRDGEWVRLWSSPQTMLAPRGTTTRQVLRMEMTRRCHIRPWG